jgi:pimeloyl-ACP methyl ester carboxylesterase
MSQTVEQSAGKSRKRGCLSYIRRGLAWLGITLIALVGLGVIYQAIATETDKRAYSPRGQLYEVNGHDMHMICMGEGSPAVILQAGGSAESLWWYHVQNQLARHTRVCAYDRPGHGWSEPTSVPPDAHTIVEELHALLKQAGVPAPYIVAGHSFGALWARIFAARYPDEVVGTVLVDSTFLIPRGFASDGEFDAWKRSNDALKAVEWALYRTGLVRLISPGDFQMSGYPPDLVPELAALRSPNRVFDADYAEQIATRRAFTDASTAAENLGNRPLAVLWAADTAAMMQRIPALHQLHDELDTFSSNSMTRTIAGASHGSILGNEQHAQRVSDTILDVIAAARVGSPLAQ